MARNRSAVAALQKLEENRKALDQKQRELEAQAAREIGDAILGSGLERFSGKGLKRVAKVLGTMGEEAALSQLTADPLPGASAAKAKSDQPQKERPCRVRQSLFEGEIDRRV